MRAISTEDERFNNNFDILRLIAAYLVLFYHSYALLNLGNLDPLYSLTGSISMGELGVIIFFVISGFLITMSWHRSSSALKYLWSRALRIVPGLIGVSLVTVFIIGPLVTSYSIVDYFQSGLTWSYFRVVTVFGIFPHTPDLPGVFVNNPFPYAANSSLWTLPVEFSMYIVILLLGLVGILQKKRSLLAITFVAAIGYCLCTNEYVLIRLISSGKPLQEIFNLINNNQNILIYPLFFMIGSLYYSYRDRIKFDLKVLLVLLIIWSLSAKTALFVPVSLICLPYIILGAASIKLPYVNRVGKYGDFSYGIYIYAFVVQQTVVHFFEGISVFELMAVSTVITLGLAVLSWRYLESKALKLKKLDLLSVLHLKEAKTVN